MSTDTMARVNKQTIERVRKAFPNLTFDSAVTNMVGTQELANAVIQEMNEKMVNMTSETTSVIQVEFRNVVDELNGKMAEIRKGQDEIQAMFDDYAEFQNTVKKFANLSTEQKIEVFRQLKEMK